MMDMKKKVLEEIMGMMDDRTLSKFKKPSVEDDKGIELTKMKVEGDELPLDIEVAGHKPEGEDEEIDADMLQKLTELLGKDEQDKC